MSSRRFDILAWFVLLVVILSWSSAPILLRGFFIEKVSVYDQNFWRFALLMIIIWPIVLLRYRNHGRVLPVKSIRIWRIALPTALAGLVAQVFFPWSVYHISPGLVGILHKQYIIWTALVAMLFFADERILLRSWQFWVGLLFAVAGAIGVVAFKQDIDFTADLLGVLFICIASIGWALYGVAIKRLVGCVGPLVGCAMAMTYQVLVLFVLALFFGAPASIVHQSSGVWSLVILSTVLNLLVPHFGLFWLIRRLGVTIINTAILSTAFVTALYSWLIFGERLVRQQWLSGVLMIAGAALASLSYQAIQNRGVPKIPLDLPAL